MTMTNSSGVTDSSGNILAGLPFTGETYTIDLAALSVVSINCTGATPNERGICSIHRHIQQKRNRRRALKFQPDSERCHRRFRHERDRFRRHMDGDNQHRFRRRRAGFEHAQFHRRSRRCRKCGEQFTIPGAVLRHR